MSRLADYCRELKAKIVSDPLPPSRVAAGWALGMFIGCSIPFGLQLVVSVPLAVLFRISKVGATVGTLITNPVTIFFIYPAQTWLVDRLLFGGTLSYARLKAMEWTFKNVRQLGFEAMSAFLLGGLFLALLLTPLTYFAVRAVVTRRRDSGTREEGKSK